MVGRTNAGGSGGVKGMPQFTYTGTYSLIDDGDKNWRIKFLTSGTLTFSKLGTGNGMIDIFCVGGGGGGYRYCTEYGAWFFSSGGGGYTTTVSNNLILKDTEYTITIGDGKGSTSSQTGGASSFGTLCTANGGNGGVQGRGGNGGSGGGPYSTDGGQGGTDGGNGSQSTGGIGQGTTTREFGEATGDLYSTGGGANIVSEVANSGNGGTCSGLVTRNGASGIVIIRNHRSA